MVELMIAIFTGWLGGYRFYKKQFIWGIIYLLTGGLFVVGWIYDIICAYKAMPQGMAAFSETIEIKGSFAECKHDPKIKRSSVIEGLSLGTELSVEIAYYKGAPYLQILAPSGLDIGAFPSETSKAILANYPKAKIKVVLTDKTDVEHPFASITVRP